MNKPLVLNRNNDFRRIYARGRSYVHPALVLYVQKNRKNVTRTGITASKKIGKAVRRNRARRVIREAYRQVAPQVQCGYDLIFVARAKTVHVKSAAVCHAMQKLLGAAGVLEKRGESLGKTR